MVGTCYGRIRQMKDDLGHLIKEAGPSTPVEVTGISDVPSAGDRFIGFDTEKQARQVAEERTMRKIEQERHGDSAMTLEDIYAKVQEGDIQTINVIIKADIFDIISFFISKPLLSIKTISICYEFWKVEQLYCALKSQIF